MAFYDEDRYKALKLPHPLLLHWVLNPGLAINEFVLGQRMPELTLIDRHSEKSLAERGYIPCPHCQTLHPARLWSKTNALFHYAGLYCPSCEQKIPSLLNVFTLALLAVTFPLWKPASMLFADRFKAWELARLEKAAQDEGRPPVMRGSLYAGLFFGISMAVYFAIWNSLEKGLDAGVIVTALAAGLVSGIVFGVLFRAFMTSFLLRRGRPRQDSHSRPQS